ncbi:MAG TPA: phosphoribosylanthranilate isomerase [Acidobacteriota bacterium]|nr:phosphoribosylanthranilate isomerase [Acidobacteriota bacterium]
MKICGLTRTADAHAAVDAGCDALGLVLWPESSRYVTAATAAEIGRTVSPGVKVVGVFVDADVEMIMRWASRIRLDAAQLCGRMPNGPWAELAESLTLIRSIGLADSRVTDSERIECISDYLLDAATVDAPGGTGTTFDWSRAGSFQSWGRLWLAGGLDADNVGAAIAAVHPYAVDVSTGVEDAPGRKSHDKIAAFIAAVRAADRET